MPEPKFIGNHEKEIETVVLYPTKATDVNKKSEDSQVIVTRKPPIWKRILVFALIFLSGFATSVVFQRVRRHFHGRGRFDHDKHHHHPHDGQREPDDETLVFFENGFQDDKMFEQSHPMLPPPMNDPHIKNQGMRHHGKDRKHDGSNRKHPPFFHSDSSISSSSISSDSMDEEEPQDIMLHPPMNDPQMKNQGMMHHGKSRKHDDKDRKNSRKDRKHPRKNRKNPRFVEPQDIMDNMMEPLPESEKEQYNPDIDIEPEVELEDIDPLVSFEDKLNEESFINVSRQEESP